MVAGLLACALGYAPFVVLPSYLFTTQRTFIWTSPGAAMVWLAVLLMLSRLHKGVGAAAGVLLLCGALGAQLFQFHHYERLSQTQQAILRAIVTSFDGDFRGKILLISDESNTIGHTWTLGDGNLEGALSYLYGHGVGRIEVCRMPAGEWQRSDSLYRKGNCARNGDSWLLSSPPPVRGPGGFTYADPMVRTRLAADQLIVLTIKPDFSGLLESGAAAPPAPTTQASPLGRRLRGSLALAPDAGMWKMFRDQQPATGYRWSFGDWWRLDVPTHGAGWREAEWQVESLKQHSVAWKTEESATLDFELRPQLGPYRMRGQFGAFANDAVRRGMSLLINGHALPVTLTAADGFDVLVRPEFLVMGMNEVTVRAPVAADYYGVSLQLDWIDIQPQ
jgi:hypothetical protein